jgi:hypothetical protein
MPRGQGQYNMGGQRRTAQFGCGYVCSGTHRECEGKIRLHLKVCMVCQLSGVAENNKKRDKSFNRTLGDINKWHGYDGKGNKVNQMVSSCYAEGEEYIIAADGKSAEEQMNNAKKILEEIKLQKAKVEENKK